MAWGRWSSTFANRTFHEGGETTTAARVVTIGTTGSSRSATVTCVKASSEKHSINMLADRILAVPVDAEGERKSKAGILIPATAELSRRLAWADVVVVGPHVRSVRAGDKVLYNPDDRFEVEVQGEEYVILRERDVHAVASSHADSDTGLYL